jgi:hypothetical protein
VTRDDVNNNNNNNNNNYYYYYYYYSIHKTKEGEADRLLHPVQRLQMNGAIFLLLYTPLRNTRQWEVSRR